MYFSNHSSIHWINIFKSTYSVPGTILALNTKSELIYLKVFPVGLFFYLLLSFSTLVRVSVLCLWWLVETNIPSKFFVQIKHFSASRIILLAIKWHWQSPAHRCATSNFPGFSSELCCVWSSCGVICVKVGCESHIVPNEWLPDGIPCAKKEIGTKLTAKQRG